MWQNLGVAPPVLIGVFAALFGLVIGSFLNVCIVRIPERKSIVVPASACPKCGAAIKPWDNIPVVSWLLLGGKCRSCKTKISWMYPVVELLTAALFWGCYYAFGLTTEALKWAIFSALVIVLVFTDMRERILPDVINFSGFAAGLLLSLVTKPSDGIGLWIANRIFDFPPPAPQAAPAATARSPAILRLLRIDQKTNSGGGLLWLVAEAYFRMRGREGMGLGDVKMMLMAGAFLGLKRTLLTILAGSVLGSVLGLAFMLAKRKGSDYELPFGTFLGMAAVLVMFFGTPLVNWYLSLMMVR